MRRYRLAALACTALISGCALTAQYGAAPRIPVGTELVVHERLPRQDGEDARVFIQNGEAIARGDVNRYEVACAISLHRRSEEMLDDAVRPGRFIVIEGSRSWARSDPGNGDDDFIDPPTRLNYFTEMEIRSDLQPQVDELRCRYRGYRIQDDAPGPREIRRALGGLGTLRFPGDGKD